MVNTVKIITAFYGIVGLRQPYNPVYALLDDQNLESRSGLYVTDNAFAKIEYLKDTQDYEAITAEQFNKYLKEMQQSSISNVVSRVFNQADYIDTNLLYQFSGSRIDTDILPFGFVGYRIRVSNEKNVAFKINRVLLDFAGTGFIELALFSSGQRNPLFTKEIEITEDHQNIQLDWSVDNSGNTYKGEYYLGYVTDGLTVFPYKRDYERSSYRSSFTYLEIDKICIKDYTGITPFDIRNISFMNEDTGLNPDITVYEDFTDLVIQNQMLFARAIHLDFSISFIHKYAASLRSNRNERLSAEMLSRAVMEIEGSGSDGIIKGLRPVLGGVIADLTAEMNKLKQGYNGGPIQVITVE